ncbi:MAG TPA: 5-formyltetrahydrofolate cyclo-ligase [Lentimicrobium sp.]|jgi:5-formyltetrahydrofolate cyclo-ligase|nr:5-formyltetrahydrofolate cyclo-ligase [Lentimicrobium sp.]
MKADIIQEEKKSCRRQVSAMKAAMSDESRMEASVRIMHRIETLPQFCTAEIILAYWSFGGEVHTHDLIRKWAGSKRIMLPSVNGDEMVIKQYEGERRMTAGDLYGIPEPEGTVFTALEKIDLIVVPGIAFDRNRNRMGRGKAYYDRFLTGTNAHKAGICFNFQLFDRIPADSNDVRMDMVITESELIGV